MKALILLAQGFEELEAVTLIDVLRRGGIEVISAGITEGPVESARKVKILPDTVLNRVSAADFDLIALPGGQPGTTNLQKNSGVLSLLKEFKSQNKWIAALCAAPMVLSAAGLLKGIRFTCYPGCEGAISEGIYEPAAVIEDGKILTSKGPATAMPFALALIEKLAGKKAAEKVGQDLLWIH